MADNTVSSPRGLGGLFARRSGKRLHWTDWVSYGFLIIGVFVMFGPVLWVVLSSLKSPASLSEFPPTFLPYATETVAVAGYEEPLDLYTVTLPDGSTRKMAQIRRIGLQAQMIDPQNPSDKISVNIADRVPERKVAPAWNNYTDLFAPNSGRNMGLYTYNSVFITVVATIITVVMNAMAAFALSKYRFKGRDGALVAILATLMIPSTVVLVPVFMIVGAIGLVGNLWGVILPTVATPTGVFLLRQYMLTIPDELLEAARMDHATEWRIFWRIIMPLSAPALAVVAIFSMMSRWNDFLLPLVMLNRPEKFTLQLALNSFQGENVVQYNYLLAMTVLTALPVALVFVGLQRYIASGIASTGIK
tara:strand:+ start:24570 stop:25652 length:1083 start_codon:yes stop_codon:yes gene_type:complete